jgi:hypothetical protein
VDRYHARLVAHFRAYRARHFPGLPDGVWHHDGVPLEYAHILPKERFELNILPSIRARFWRWFEAQNGNIKLHYLFHHLNSPQGLCFNLFFPFLEEDGRRVDPRLVQALAMDDAHKRFEGHFETVLDKDEDTRFDFCLSAEAGSKALVELKFSEAEFGSSDADQVDRISLEQHYRAHFDSQIDARLVDEKAFFENHQVLRSICSLAQHPESRLFFIYPRANESLAKSEQTIVKIAAQAMGTRVFILHLETLFERIVSLVHDDPALLDHLEQFREKYLLDVL